MNIYLVIFITLIAALVASFSQMLYKKGIESRLNGLRDIILLFRKRNIIIGAFGYLLSLAIYLYALSNAPLSIVYPTFASTFIFIAIISWAYLKEDFGRLRAVGVALVFLGVIIIAASL